MYRLLALAIAASTALSVLLTLPATAGAQQRPPIVEKLAKTYGLARSGKSKRSAIPSTYSPQDAISLDHGFGSPKPTRSPMRGKISRASR